jgi:hypothetical protein
MKSAIETDNEGHSLQSIQNQVVDLISSLFFDLSWL